LTEIAAPPSHAQVDELIRTSVFNLTADLSVKERHHRFLDLFSVVTGNQVCTLLRYREER
jgi:hypothetical protein